MADILKKICKDFGIELVYTNNKVIVLSCSTENNSPRIRVHRLFRECSEDIARAIVGYYTKIEGREENIKIIKDYINKNTDIKRYRINPPTDEFNSEVVKGIMPQKTGQNVETDLIELNISSITKKKFDEDEYTEDTDDSLKVSEGNILEVNIVVNPFNT